ncbi:MAG: hypothetical protein FWF90_12060 [Promicromonosporaceae bacterium]|nr:hypothetical protein [Promicromonosporaceae bacterium]
MKAVLLTGAGIALVDGAALGVATALGREAAATAALIVGLAAAVVCAWLTPDAPEPEHALVTLGIPASPEPQPVTEAEQPDVLPAPHPAHLALPDAPPVPPAVLPTPAAA